MSVPLVLDRRARHPLHRQVYDVLRQSVLSGQLRPGSRLPSTRELACQLGIARVTVVNAYDQLISEGYLETRHGAGTYVSRELPDTPALRTAGRPAQRALPVRLSRYASRLDTEQPEPDVAAGVIDLSCFLPDLGQFPIHVWRRTIAARLRKCDAETLGYARHGRGVLALRVAVAAYVARTRAVRCDADQVLIVNGSQQALDLIARVLLDPGDRVVVENPGYPGARQVFRANGALITPAPVDPQGIIVSALPSVARLVYVTPSHQFPRGASMSLARRLSLIEWAARAGAVIVEDDYDSEYRYEGAPLPSLQSLAERVPVIYMGTFSRVMFPSLRLGYMVVPGDLLDACAKAKSISDRHTSALEQGALADFIRAGHLDRHVRRMRRLYGRRRQALIDALVQQFGADVAILGDAAGMHLPIRFTRSAPFDGAQGGVRMTSARKYDVKGVEKSEFVLGFTALGERTLREGVRRLKARLNGGPGSRVHHR